MDPELLRQRAAFQKHAARTVSVQQRPQIQLVSFNEFQDISCFPMSYPGTFLISIAFS